MHRKTNSQNVPLYISILTNIVFPLPGGPNKRRPLAGQRSPVNNSGLCAGRMTISCRDCFANSRPATKTSDIFTAHHCTFLPLSLSDIHKYKCLPKTKQEKILIRLSWEDKTSLTSHVTVALKWFVRQSAGKLL
jgi:hypothetical protein